MNVFYTTDDKFVPQVAASMCSVFENNRDAADVHIYIASSGITGENKEKLGQFAQRYGRSLSIIEIGDVRDHLDFDIDTLGWSNIVVARLILDKLLPAEVKCVLYLDGDTIVRTSLSALWQADMGKSVVGACIEPTVTRSRRESLGMGSNPYFNSGVLLIDLKKWREEETGKRILAFYKERGGKLFAPDQDAINGALSGEICALPPQYNYCNTFDFYPYRTLQKLAAPAAYITQRQYDDAKANPAVVHYLGEERPWRAGNTHKYADDFLRYLKMTPWADLPMEEGWGTYFKCFKLFNTVTKPFPMLRYKIIDALIPAFMRRRAKQLKK